MMTLPDVLQNWAIAADAISQHAQVRWSFMEWI
jgi:hypothetical protein